MGDVEKPSVLRRELLPPDYSAYLSRFRRADERTRTADLLITRELFYWTSNPLYTTLVLGSSIGLPLRLRSALFVYTFYLIPGALLHSYARTVDRRRNR